MPFIGQDGTLEWRVQLRLATDTRPATTQMFQKTGTIIQPTVDGEVSGIAVRIAPLIQLFINPFTDAIWTVTGGTLIQPKA